MGGRPPHKRITRGISERASGFKRQSGLSRAAIAQIARLERPAMTMNCDASPQEFDHVNLIETVRKEVVAGIALEQR
jgi:hypothetical protein